jgi:hypothetical protein
MPAKNKPTNVSKVNTSSAVALLEEAIAYEANAWDAPIEDGEQVNGADLVDFFGEWRQRVKKALEKES